MQPCLFYRDKTAPGCGDCIYHIILKGKFICEIVKLFQEHTHSLSKDKNMLHYTPFSKKGISILAASTLSVSFLAFAPSATATEIDDGLVDSIVAANTKSPSPSTGEKWVPNDGSLKINEGSLLPQQDSITTPVPSKNAGTKTKLIEREDGNQLVSVSDGDAPLELSFEFSDFFLKSFQADTF